MTLSDGLLTEFNWDDVRGDKYKECYLGKLHVALNSRNFSMNTLIVSSGYSLKLGGGPWYEQKKAGAATKAAPVTSNSAEELNRVKQQEQELLNEALYVQCILCMCLP